MPGVLSRENFRFLYRQDQGRIDRRAFWIASLPILMILTVMTLVWLAVKPQGARDLSSGVFFDAPTAFAYAYLLVYTACMMLGAIMFYFVGAKRLRDGARPPWLAAAPFLMVYAAGAVHWAAPRSDGGVGPLALWAVDVLAIASVVWAVLDMGLRKSRP
jgi:uncharacterized membrane protein YhaH (DUF805 family)